MSKKAIRAAVKLYRSFREAAPGKIGVVEVSLPAAVAVIGYVESIKYRTTHGKKPEFYEHPFMPGSRPLLVASSDGRQLLLLGGRFRFGARGIVDIDAKGKPVYDPQHGEDLGVMEPGFMRRRQANPGKLRQKDVFAQIRELGLTVKKTGEGGEVRVAFRPGRLKDTEPSAYYTDDLADALGTARAMARARPDLAGTDIARDLARDMTV